MTKKIGQVTLYNYNYGSALQCFATQKVLKHLGYSCDLLIRQETGKIGFAVKVFNYLLSYSSYIKHPSYINHLKKLRASAKSKHITALTDSSKRFIESFLNKNVSLRFLPYAKLCRIAKTNEYLAFISGSDQVWSGSWFYPNPMYFLRFAPPYKKIAWAPSFGLSHVEKYNIRKFKKYISDFAYLSAREKSGVEIIKDLTNRSAAHIIDPALVLTAEEWESLLPQNGNLSFQENTALVFFLDKPSGSAIEAMKLEKEKQNLRFISFGYNYDELSEIVSKHKDGSPFDFLNLIINARCVFTDSFHAAAFSVQFKSPFCVFKRQYTHSYDQSARILDFLELCGFKREFSNSVPIINDSFDEAHKILDKKRIEAIAYISNALKETEVNRIAET